MTKKQKVTKTVQNSKFPKILSGYILPFVFLLFIILITTFKISGDDDLFWHLQVGKYITTNNVIPSADVFGFATAGQEWIPFEWGFDALAYNIYSFSGYTGLSIFRTLIFVCIFFLVYRLSLKLKLNQTITFFILLLLTAALFERFLIKPQIISYLFTTILLYIFLSYSLVKREGSRLIYFLPVIFLIWANMHMGVLSGVVLFTIFVFTEALGLFKPQLLLNKENPSSRNQFIKLVMLYAASILVLLMNPQGMGTYTYVYSHLQMKMMEDVFEWRSPFDKMFAGSFYIYVYYIYLAAACTALFYAFKRKDILSGIVILVFAVFSTRTARFSIDFMLVSTPFILLAINYFFLNSSKSKNAVNSNSMLDKIVPLVLSAVMLAGIILLPGSNLYSIFNYDRITGFGVDEKAYPVKAVNFIKQNNIADAKSKPFNTYDCGGYLIWEVNGAKNFIDSRGLNDEIYYSFKSINNKEHGFEKKFESYGFDYVLWSFPKLPWNNTELKTSIISYLIKNNENWKLVYWDDFSFVFVKNNEKYKSVIEQNEFKYANPYYYVFEKDPLKNALASDPQRVTEEIKRNLRLNPDGIFIQAMAKSFNVKP
jgi:integral membrane sensor domain MASE1